jgi:hypothetical protein
MTSHIPESVFDRLVETLREYYGEDWITDQAANRSFARGAESVFRHFEGVQMIGDAEMEHGHQMNFNLWVEDPVDDVLAADELAYGLFAEIADDLFVCTRQVEKRGIRYRFITGNGSDGHLGSIHFIGPNATEFANMHRLRGGRRAEYHA